MLKKFSLMSFFCIYCSLAWSTAYSVVYRADDRLLNEIRAAGGMWPWATGLPDNNLLHHFEGESVEDHSSSFVSTTSSLRIAVEHAASLARPNSEDPFDMDFLTYIYVIRPDHRFFDVDPSLIYARDQLPEDSPDRERLNRLISDYTGMDEVVAWTGFEQNRIMSFAELSGEMLNRYGVSPGSPLLSEAFWATRWINNDGYNHEFDEDTSNVNLYTNSSEPSGIITQVINGDQPPTPLSFTCMGVHPSSSSFSKAVQDETVCSKNQRFNIVKVIYDRKILETLIVLFNMPLLGHLQ